MITTISANLFFIIMFITGFSSMINQVVWQRAIKIYLGGAEAICSMIVVLVFMLGMGIGSLIISKKVSSLKNPLHTLAKFELSLFVINLIVLFLLKADVSSTVFAVQRAAMLMGIPMKALYALSGVLLLIVPCSIMGMTMSVASEAAKSQLQFENNWIVDNMFFINTIGSCIGSVATGFKLIPYFGLTVCLLVALALNLLTAILCHIIYKNLDTNNIQTKQVESDTVIKETNTESNNRFIKAEEIATFFFGFVSLGYEMYLYRIMPLVYTPLPHIFSIILASYLLLWAIGVYLAGRVKDMVSSTAFLCGLTILFSPMLLENHRATDLITKHFIAIFAYCVPCLCFGMLYGQLLNRQLKNWGKDVGRYMGSNTIGSCLGIVITTMIGGYTNYLYSAALFALILFAIALWLILRETGFTSVKKYSGASISLVVIAIIAAFANDVKESKIIYDFDKVTFFDPVGITEVTRQGNMIWDGLWHSKLSNGKSHIGTNNWYLATIPYLCSTRKFIDKSLVIGFGTGITVSCLASSSRIKSVKSYEINRSIDKLTEMYYKQTLCVRDNPKVEIVWQDARTGLSLNEEEFPLITQQPLYLNQAGSSNLLSEEYLKTVLKRMTNDGVFLVYAHSFGNKPQKQLVHKTLRKVFPYCMSFLDGYMYVVSKSPIVYTRESLEKKLSIENDEMVEGIKSKFNIDQLLKIKDPENDDWKACPFTISDDYPVLEYVDELTEMSKSWTTVK